MNCRQYHVLFCQSSSPQQIKRGLSRLQLLAKMLNPELNDTRGIICRAKEPAITMVATTVAPCGHCRQFLNELRGAPHVCRVLSPRMPAPPKNASRPYNAAFQLAELLPEALVLSIFIFMTTWSCFGAKE